MDEAMQVLENALMESDWSSATSLVNFVLDNTDDWLELDEIHELIGFAKSEIENGYPVRWFLDKR